MRGIDEQLLRHAAAYYASAAHAIFFGKHDPGAIIGCDPRSANAARATADDKEVDVVKSAMAASALPAFRGFQVLQNHQPDTKELYAG